MNEKLGLLRAEFLRELPVRAAALAAKVQALIAKPDDPGLRSEAKKLAHQLHGTAGSYGLAAVGDAASGVEEALGQAGQEGLLAAAACVQRLGELVRALSLGAA